MCWLFVVEDGRGSNFCEFFRCSVNFMFSSVDRRRSSTEGELGGFVRFCGVVFS